jgi:hypothetical protein
MSLAKEIFKKMTAGQPKPEIPEPPVGVAEGTDKNPQLFLRGNVTLLPVKNDEMALEAKDEPQGSLPLTQAEGKVKKAKMPPVKIYSRLFNEEIYIVADQEEMETLASKGVKEVVYMAWEIPVLKGMDKERLRAVHLTKKVFPGSALA